MTAVAVLFSGQSTGSCLINMLRAARVIFNGEYSPGKKNMGMLRIVEKGSDFNQTITFPHFYMNDFSVLGLVVSELPKVVRTLQDKGIDLQKEKEVAWISFPDKQQLDMILKELTAREITYTLSDLVSCTYQG